jgi:hypothetical protein
VFFEKNGLGFLGIKAKTTLDLVWCLSLLDGFHIIELCVSKCKKNPTQLRKKFQPPHNIWELSNWNSKLNSFRHETNPPLNITRFKSILHWAKARSQIIESYKYTIFIKRDKVENWKCTTHVLTIAKLVESRMSVHISKTYHHCVANIDIMYINVAMLKMENTFG